MSGSSPTLALIHGLGGSRRAWAPVLPLLADAGVRAVPIELPGYGSHRSRAAEPSIEAMAAAIEPAVRATGGELVVAGHSMGGLVATALAERMPDRLGRIVVVNSSLTPASRLTAHAGDEGILSRPVLGRLAWRLAPRGKFRSGLRSAFAPGFDVPEVFVDDLRACSLRTFTCSSAAVDRYLAARSLPERLAALEVPATLLYGTCDLRLDRAAVEEARALLREPIIELEGVGHTPMWEAPEATAETLLAAARAVTV